MQIVATFENYEELAVFARKISGEGRSTCNRTTGISSAIGIGRARTHTGGRAGTCGRQHTRKRSVYISGRADEARPAFKGGQENPGPGAD